MYSKYLKASPDMCGIITIEDQVCLKVKDEHCSSREVLLGKRRRAWRYGNRKNSQQRGKKTMRLCLCLAVLLWVSDIQPSGPLPDFPLSVHLLSQTTTRYHLLYSRAGSSRYWYTTVLCHRRICSSAALSQTVFYSVCAAVVFFSNRLQLFTETCSRQLAVFNKLDNASVTSGTYSV